MPESLFDLPELYGENEDTPDLAVHPAGPDVRRTDPPPSKKAAKANFPKRESQKGKILRSYLRAYPKGLTDTEAWRGAGLQPQSSPWKRCSDLLAQGLIVETGTGKTWSGEEGRTCTLSPYAYAKLTETP